MTVGGATSAFDDMSYFYGPVPSRRLGFSLGVDVTSKQTCSFDCIYCQLGRSSKKTIRRFTYVKLKDFEKELRSIVKAKTKIDFVTISGSGEPTLHKGLDRIIKSIKKITRNKHPVCVITNSSLLYRKQIRKELLSADVIMPSLDAVSNRIFRKINRPYSRLKISNIIEGLIKFRKQFKGKIWLEIMLVKGINDTISEAKKFKEAVLRIKPDKVQLNMPVRPSEIKCSIPSLEQIHKISNIIDRNIEVINLPNYSKYQKAQNKDKEKKILEFLKVRPATLQDLSSALGLNASEVLKYVDYLTRNNKLKQKTQNNKKYFVFSYADDKRKR